MRETRLFVLSEAGQNSGAAQEFAASDN